MIARQFRWSGIPGSAVVVQQLTLWIGMLGGMLASRSGRLLGLSSSSFLPESWIAPAKIFWSAALAAVSTCLAYASWVFVQSERESGSYLLPGLPKWTALAIMLVGFAVIALRAVLGSPAYAMERTGPSRRLGCLSQRYSALPFPSAFRVFFRSFLHCSPLPP